MERDDEYKDFVDGLVSQIRVLNDMAVREYTPLVDDICRRIASQNEVERLLDYLFDFAGNDKILLLYRRVCQHYFQIYPESIAWYIMEYRKEYDRESLIGTEYEYLLHEDYDEDDNASKSDSHRHQNAENAKYSECGKVIWIKK